MYKKLSETGNTEINKTRADLIKKLLTKFQRIIESTPKADAVKIEENEKIIDIVEKILELNNKIQSRQGLKILTPSQLGSRLPITLAQLKVVSNSEKLKKRNQTTIVFFVQIKKINQNNL